MADVTILFVRSYPWDDQFDVDGVFENRQSAEESAKARGHQSRDFYIEDWVVQPLTPLDKPSKV